MRDSTFCRCVFLFLTAALAVGPAQGQGHSVSLRVIVQSPSADHRHGQKATAENIGMTAGDPHQIVAWLTATRQGAVIAKDSAASIRSYVLTQKNKEFLPHLLVIPTGSKVDFPNLDPFFHNVFSLYNGRRFDLGLYEEGSRRSVRFDHDGVSYIFCNIHPEMGAVVISLSTPYYAVSSKDGSLVIQDVPSGDYELNLWSEDVSAGDLAAARQHVLIPEHDLQLPAITLKATASSTGHHLNKFGEEYKQARHDPY